MPNRHSRRVRFVALSIAALLAAALAPSLALATPTPAPRTVAQVQQQLTALMRKNSQLVDQYNAAVADVSAKTKAAQAAQQTQLQAQASYTQAREAVSATVAAQYEGGSFSSAGALLTSDSGQSYLDQLNTLSMIAEHNAGVAQELDAARATAVTASKTAATLLKAATKRRDQLAAQKRSLDAQFAKYTALLHTLTLRQQATFTNTLSAPVTSAALVFARASVSAADVPAQAKQAVDFALAQIGKPYVYGSAGPGSFDCSGLTMAAYATAGISLPHNAAAQYGYGHHVALSDLRPGDLIFYYQPIGHVVIYVGGGMAVSASTEGVPIGEISIDNWDANQITGATRIVG